MSYTNTTTHYNLPQYVATDKPKYLTDFNETMAAIDTQMYTNAQAAATADSKAVAAQGTADSAVSSIGTLNVQINGNPTDPSDTGLAGQVSEIDTDLDTVQSLIGSGQPTTSNQTIIGAINGLEGAVAPREDGEDLANSYSVGDQFARGGSVYEALISLSAGTAFASLTLNTDYKVADTLVEQIKKLSPEGFVIDKFSQIVHVTGDGVKTFSALLNELHTALENVVSSLANGVSIDVLNMYTDDTNHPFNTVPSFPIHLANNSSLANYHFSQVSGGSSVMFLQDIGFYGTNPYIHRIDFAMTDGAATTSDISSEIVGDGKKITILYRTYKSA